MLPITYETAASRALKLRCPRCGDGPLFRGLISMNEHCRHCNLKFERAPGYYLGSTYINYGFITLTMTVMYLALHFGAEVSNRVLTPILISYCAIVPIILFRYARAWWLAMDCYFDPTSFAPEADAFVDGESAVQVESFETTTEQRDSRGANCATDRTGEPREVAPDAPEFGGPSQPK